MAVTEETGDIINYAVYKRNSDVEEMYNVKLNFTVRDGSSESGQQYQWFTTITASILAGDGSVDLAGGYGYMLASNSLDGNYVMLMRMSLKENKDISSMWAKNENMYKKKMGELISALK